MIVRGKRPRARNQPALNPSHLAMEVEGAGADPSQRIGTRLGALCRVEIADYVSVGGAHNTVKPVGDDGKGLKENLGSSR